MSSRQSAEALNDKPMPEDEAPKRGVKTKIFGVCLLLLGMMNVMLAWRGSFDVPGLQIGILVAGAFLYIVGVIRSGES